MNNTHILIAIFLALQSGSSYGVGPQTSMPLKELIVRMHMLAFGSIEGLVLSNERVVYAGSWNKNVKLLTTKQKDDPSDTLWIHDKSLLDFVAFIHQHPGTLVFREIKVHRGVPTDFSVMVDPMLTII